MIRRALALAAFLAMLPGLSPPSAAAELEDSPPDPDEELSAALVRGDEAGARAAVENGARLNYIGRRYRPFNNLCGAVRGQDRRAARILLDLGASPNVECLPGMTPLLEAASQKDAEMIELLLAHGAPIDVSDDHGITPLGHALCCDRPDRESTRVLRRHGASKGDVWDVYIALNMMVGLNLALESDPRARSLWGARPEVAWRRPFAALGWGAYAEAVTRSWQEAMLGGGLLLVPSFWIVPSVGAYARHAAGTGWTPGISAGLFVGSHAASAEIPERRDGNPPSSLAHTKRDIGVRIEGRWGSVAADRSVAIALQMDLNYLWMVPYRILAAFACCY